MRQIDPLWMTYAYSSSLSSKSTQYSVVCSHHAGVAAAARARGAPPQARRPHSPTHRADRSCGRAALQALILTCALCSLLVPRRVHAASVLCLHLQFQLPHVMRALPPIPDDRWLNDSLVNSVARTRFYTTPA